MLSPWRQFQVMTGSTHNAIRDGALSLCPGLFWFTDGATQNKMTHNAIRDGALSLRPGALSLLVLVYRRRDT